MGMVSEFKEFICARQRARSRGRRRDRRGVRQDRDRLVDGIVMPIVGVALGGVSVSDWKYVLKPETVDAAGKKVAEVAVQYGMFIQTLIDFLIIAFVIFLVIKAYNRMRKPASGSRRGAAGRRAAAARDPRFAEALIIATPARPA